MGALNIRNKKVADKARRLADLKGTTITKAVSAALEESLKTAEHHAMPDRDARELTEAAKAKRILPRVCSATGGLLPGIDLNNSAALQEMDDIEYVKRLYDGFP